MRWVLQILAMLGDLMLALVCALLLREGTGPDLFLFAVVFWIWFAKLDGLCAWRPSVIKAFMKNARRMGL